MRYLTATEAAEVLGMTPGGARNVLGSYDFISKNRTGHLVRLWGSEKVQRIKDERKAAGKRQRARQKPKQIKNGMSFDPAEYNPGKSFDFEVNERGKVIPPKKTFRGRKCRYDGCTTSVPTGRIFCDEHREHFKALQKQMSNHADIYQCSVGNY
jgi:hypothetical protein